jgi:CHASE1-domain containing sensor protein
MVVDLLTQMSNRLFSLRYISVALVFILGFIASCIIFKATRSRENERIQSDFNLLADERFHAIQKRINGYFEVLNSMGTTYNILGNKVDRQQFRLIVQYALLRQPDIKVLEWIPLISGAKRNEFESAGIEKGYPDFQITERNTQKKIVPAAQRNVYFPLYFFEPFYIDDNKQDRLNIGFDYASEPVLREAMENARDTEPCDPL